MPATDSFTGEADAVATGVAVLSEGGDGSAVLTRGPGFWRVRKTAGGVFITKASTFGGTQGSVTYPVTRQAAMELAEAILNVAN